VNGSLCCEDLKRAVSAAQRGEKQRGRESYCEEKRMPGEATEEGDALCYMWVSLQYILLMKNTKMAIAIDIKNKECKIIYNGMCWRKDLREYGV
jgi:hypothetical protein